MKVNKIDKLPIDEWIFYRLKPGDKIMWQFKDFEGEHKNVGEVIERSEDLLAVNMYDELNSDSSTAVKMLFEIEDVIDQMYFTGDLISLMRR